jgi:hypothetical protein
MTKTRTPSRNVKNLRRKRVILQLEEKLKLSDKDLLKRIGKDNVTIDAAGIKAARERMTAELKILKKRVV